LAAVFLLAVHLVTLQSILLLRYPAVVKLTCLDSTALDFTTRLARLLQFDDAQDAAIETTVAAILADVKARGDAAVLNYTARFDRLDRASMAALELSPASLQQALQQLPAETRSALESAAARVRDYHQRQTQESWTYTEANGTVLGQKITPLDRVGLYVPGGKAARKNGDRSNIPTFPHPFKHAYTIA
jgi:histidinol dehydrogenase